MGLKGYIEETSAYINETRGPMGLARLMQVRLSLSRLGRIVCPKPTTAQVPIRSLGGSVWLRSHSSDISVLKEEILGRHDEPKDVKTIIDLGANTGLVARALLNRHPNSRIVCVEPEADNLVMLRLNLHDHRERAVVVPKCIGGTERQGRISTDSGAWAYHLSDRGQAVEVTTMGQLLSECGIDHIDLFKCDIEGAELEVFADPQPWMQCVSHAVVEWHGPGGDTLSRVTGWTITQRIGNPSRDGYEVITARGGI